MSDTADLNLVLARILPKDALHQRALLHLRGKHLVAPFTIGVELLFVAKRFGLGCVEALGAMETHFEVEGKDVLYTAAEALDTKEIPTLFDALHLADALHRSGRLHTADERLHKTPFPTQPY